MSPAVHNPLWIRLGPLQITGFTIALALAYLIGHIACRRELVRRGHDASALTETVLVSVIGFIVGAKLYYALLTGDFGSLVKAGGLVFWGGLAGGAVAGFWWGQRRGLPVMRLADPVGIGMAAGYTVGRAGCFAVGDDYGTPWNGPLAVAFPRGLPPSTADNLESYFGIPVPPDVPGYALVAVHPTQLYEIALGFLMFVALWRMRDHRHAEGWLFGAYLVLAGVERFLIEFVRAKDDQLIASFTLAQAIALGLAIAGAMWMAARRHVTPSTPGIYATAAPG